MLSCFQLLRRSYLLLWLAALILSSSTSAAQARGTVYYVTADHGLTVAGVSLVRRALREAEAANATALVVELRSGGSLSAMWPLARELAEATVPVVGYIAPPGRNSGPVGTLLLSATHVSVMAPGSSIGFAAPLVNIPANFSTSTRQIVVDDAVKQLAAWSRERGRNPDWVEQAVRQGAIIDAERAQQLTPAVIDAVATEDELMTALQGRRVRLASGVERQLNTLGAQLVKVNPSVGERLGQLLAIPTIAFVVFVAGGIAIYLELASPGVGIPGVSGAILVIAAVIGFVLGEVRPLAVLLLAGGLVLVGLEYIVMAHGGLTLAGLVLLVLGAMYLVDPAVSPGMDVSLIAIGGVALLLMGVAGGLLTVMLRVRAQPPATGQAAMLGQIAEVRRAIAPEGFVFINGALWSAWTDQEWLQEGELVEVVGVDGLRLFVRKLEHDT